MSAMATKAVFVEVLEKDCSPSIKLTDKIKRGAYAGMFIRKDEKEAVETYVVLFSEKKGKKGLDICNLEYYNIVTIELCAADHTRFLNFRNTEEDQGEAFSRAIDILLEMQENKRVLDDPNMIDLSTYDMTGISSTIAGTHVNELIYKANRQSPGVISRYSAPARSAAAKPKSKTPKVSVIKRKRGCSAKFLKAMYKAVQEVRAGTYKPPELPKAPKENVEVADEEEDFYGKTNWYV